MSSVRNKLAGLLYFKVIKVISCCFFSAVNHFHSWKLPSNLQLASSKMHFYLPSSSSNFWGLLNLAMSQKLWYFRLQVEFIKSCDFWWQISDVWILLKIPCIMNLMVNWRLIIVACLCVEITSIVNTFNANYWTSSLSENVSLNNGLDK